MCRLNPRGTAASLTATALPPAFCFDGCKAWAGFTWLGVISSERTPVRKGEGRCLWRRLKGELAAFGTARLFTRLAARAPSFLPTRQLWVWRAMPVTGLFQSVRAAACATGPCRRHWTFPANGRSRGLAAKPSEGRVQLRVAGSLPRSGTSLCPPESAVPPNRASFERLVPLPLRGDRTVPAIIWPEVSKSMLAQSLRRPNLCKVLLKAPRNTSYRRHSPDPVIMAAQLHL